MDMFDFFFPEQAEAAHLRRISNSIAGSKTAHGSAARRNESEIDALRADVQFLSLVIAAILKRLSEQKTMSLGDVSDLLDEIDELDGLRDGGLEVGVLRGILGVIKQEPAKEGEDLSEINIVTTPRYRRR